MKTPQTLAGGIAVVLFALVILGFGIGPVSASPTSWATGNMTSMHNHGAGQHYFTKNGTWTQNSHSFGINATAQQARLQSLVTRLQGQGVDTSQLQAAIQNNDSAAIKTWLGSHASAHKGIFANGTGQKNGHSFAMNATAQQAHLQSFITNLQNKGVDVSSVQTALQNNDTATVTAWLKSFFESHPGTMVNVTRQHWHRWNQTATSSS
jgi:pyridoxine 5'-phosphate synthase PdxJ